MTAALDTIARRVRDQLIAFAQLVAELPVHLVQHRQAFFFVQIRRDLARRVKYRLPASMKTI